MSIKLLLFICLSFQIVVGQSKERPVEVIQNQTFFLSAMQNVMGSSREVVTINLPPKTIKWFYSVSAFRNEKDVKNVTSTFNLLSNLSSALDLTGVSSLTLKMLGTPPGSDYCDVYLLASPNDVNKFESKSDNWGGNFNYFREGSRENILGGVIDVSSTKNSRQYLGFRNKAVFGVNVSIQVVAVVSEEITTNGWSRDEKNKMYDYMNTSFKSSGYSKYINSIQAQDLSACVVKKMTNQYSPSDFNGFANYEMDEVMLNILKACNNELSLNIDFDELRKKSIISKDYFVGEWKDENSKFTFYDSGMLYIIWDNGLSKWGSWEFTQGTLKMKFGGDTKVYESEILEFSGEKFVFKEIDSQKTFNAVKIVK